MIDLSDSSRLTRPARPARCWRLWVAAVGALALGTMLPTAWKMSREAELLAIRQIKVEGAQGERADEIRAYADLAQGKPILQVDLDRVARRVQEHPFIKAASVRWSPPDALAIEVVERQPVLAVVLGGVYLADDSGEVFKRRSLKEDLDLPVVTGLDPTTPGPAQRQALLLSMRLLDAHRAAGSPGGVVQQIHHDAAGLTLTLQRDLEVRLGPDDLEERMQRLAHLLTRLKKAGREPAWVHLNDARRPERVAVRLRSSSEVTAGG